VPAQDDDNNLGVVPTESSDLLLGGNRPSLTDTFMNTLKTSMLEARTEWSSKIEKFKENIVDLARASVSNDQSGESVVFEELLVLFTQSAQSSPFDNRDTHHIIPHDTIANIVRLHGTYPDAVEFYIPQLIVYLLYGTFDVTARLRSAMLGMCGVSVSFAHRMHWFIQSFCMSEAGVDAGGIVVLQHLLSQIEVKGIESADIIAQSRGVGEVKRQDAHSASVLTLGYVSPTLPERLYNALDETDPDKLPTLSASEVETQSLQNVPGAGSFAVGANPYLQFPLELCRPLPSSLNNFSVNISFWMALSELSRELCLVQRDGRTNELKARLPGIQAQFLPSSIVYAPVGNMHHR
jgi:hypothetical protein